MMGYVTKVYVQIGQKVSGTNISINNSDLKAKKRRQMLIFFRQPRDTTMPRKITIVCDFIQAKSASQKRIDDMTARYEMTRT
jgi:hypothetical protein